jgi:hypothetical protein
MTETRRVMRVLRRLIKQLEADMAYVSRLGTWHLGMALACDDVVLELAAERRAFSARLHSLKNVNLWKPDKYTLPKPKRKMPPPSRQNGRRKPAEGGRTRV